MDVPDRVLADRSDRALRRLAARLEDEQRRAELDAHQPGPDAARSDARWAIRAARSRATKRASKPTPTVFSIAPSPKDGNLIWTGSDDGYVQVTRDGGKTWKNVTPKDMPDFARISLIEASPFRPGTAYVAANHYQHDDFKPYVYRTDDYGETWTKIVNGVGDRDFRARDPRGHRSARKLLYLGTEHGIYVSFDDGANWQSLKQNLPDTPVHDIKVEERDLVIATHGRGFYVMDNISPLRQWGAQTTSNLHLFKPNDVLRGLDRGARVRLLA